MKPANLIIDLLRTYKDKGINVKVIMETGLLFNFSENLIRVSLSRLVSRDIVEKQQRGIYRLSRAAHPINDFTEMWRLGVARCKPWLNNKWICIHSPSLFSKRCLWILSVMGFRPVREKFWIRPDNLQFENCSLDTFLHQMGLTRDILLVSDATLDINTSQSWFALFDMGQMENDYSEMEAKLKASQTRLSALSLNAAKKESFHLGGEAIALLATDPQIPTEYQASKTRQTLWETLQSYDLYGREIWSLSPETQPLSTPTQGLLPTVNS